MWVLAAALAVLAVATVGTVFALNYEGEDFCQDTPSWPNGTYLGQMHPYHSDFYRGYAERRGWDPCVTWAQDQRNSAIRGIRELGYTVTEPEGGAPPPGPSAAASVATSSLPLVSLDLYSAAGGGHAGSAGVAFTLNYEGEDFCQDTPSWPNGTYLGQMHPFHSDFYRGYAERRGWDPCVTWAQDQRNSAIPGLRELGYTVIAPPEQEAVAAPAAAPGRLAFASHRDGNYEIYVMQADGSGVTRLTDHDADDLDPAWSPDGRRLAFMSGRDGNQEIYVMQADGSGVTRLTDNVRRDSHPAWSPDGRRIAFYSNRHGDWDIYVMNADGSEVTRLTYDRDAGESRPAWSPDGRRIAFQAKVNVICFLFMCSDAGWEIFVMNADGSEVTRLTTNRTNDVQSAWSPDGQRIAFSSNRDGENSFSVHVMNADGSEVTRLTTNRRDDDHPAWSPDGQRLAFMSRRDGNWEIYVMQADGSGVTRLTDNDARDGAPAWGVQP